MPAEPGTTPTQPPDKLSIAVFSGDFDRIHYALVMASGQAAAADAPVTLFFTMWAVRALRRADGDGQPGWSDLVCGEGDMTATALDKRFAERGVATFEELVAACRELGVRFIVCEMGLRALGIAAADLRDDIAIERAGIVTFLGDASATGAILFV